MEYLCVPYVYAMHGYSNLISGCVAKHSAVQDVEKLLIEFMVCFSLLRCDLQGFFSMGHVVLVSF
jgi:hypothetical protein